MAIHVTRAGRGSAVVRYVARPGERHRPQTRRPGKGSGGASGAGPVKTGGSSGTHGDFGADFE
jgi:hypothetical protein